MKQVIVDESSGNPFPSKIVLNTSLNDSVAISSHEGFFHNDQASKQAAKKLAHLIELEAGKTTIDMGYGTNLSIAKAMEELGMNSYGLDSLDQPENETYQHGLFIPPRFNTIKEGIKVYYGMIEDIKDPKSELRFTKFDLTTFWGSWESGGNNFAIGGEMAEARIRNETNFFGQYENFDDVCKLISYRKIKILKDAAEMTNPNGGSMIVSSRYAGHGAGFTTQQLPWEKRIMLNLVKTFENIGAKEVYVIGVSKEETQKQLGQHEQFEGEAKKLQNDNKLFNSKLQPYELRTSKETINEIVDMQIPLGRIDAVYGRF